MAKSKRRDKAACSMAQQRQRELSWLLYITEGAIGNYQHALVVNAYTLPHADLVCVEHALAQLQEVSATMRALMGAEA